MLYCPFFGPDSSTANYSVHHQHSETGDFQSTHAHTHTGHTHTEAAPHVELSSLPQVIAVSDPFLFSDASAACFD